MVMSVSALGGDMTNRLGWSMRWTALLVIPWLLLGIATVNPHSGAGGYSFGVALITLWPMIWIADAMGRLDALTWTVGLLLSALWLFLIILAGRMLFVWFKG